MRLFLSVFVLLAFVPLPLPAQISITSGDLDKPVGYTLIQDYENGPLTVNLGQSGGPRTWDFSSYTMTLSSSMEVVNVAGTPFGGDFPTANKCFSDADDQFDTNVYTYMNLTSNAWTFLGIGFQTPDTSYSQTFNPQAQIPLPIDMGDSWIYETGWGDTLGPIIMTIVSRSHNTVDAWGTMTVPMGAFDVLRVVSYDTTITSTIVPPFEFSDTLANINYDWMGKDPIYVAGVSSMDGETNPNFTTADWIERAGSGDVGIDENDTAGGMPHTFGLDQNFPNPFNPHTEITFSVDEENSGQVELSVYSLRGTKVKTLVSNHMTAGRYTVMWSGKNDRGETLPSGVYLYRLTVDGESLTRKMVLSK